MTRRVEQAASTIQRALQELIARGLQDPRIGGLVTVTGVRVTPDLKEATVMVSVLPAEKQDLTLHGLRAAAPHLRHELGEWLRMRATPTLNFKLDLSLKKEAGVLGALAKVAEERRAREGADAPRDSAEGSG